jgi:exodeoxyribonuclease VII large subunit
MYFSEKLTNIVSSTLEASRLQLMAVAEKLDALSPLAVIKRGYAITEIDNEFVTSVKDIKRNDEVKVSLCDGSFKAIVTDITEKE